MINIGWLTLTKLLKQECMNKELIELIHEFNSNLIKEDNSKRIILCTLNPEGMTIAPNKNK